ncbi:MAG: hypothetical protein CBD21_00710 [bacterium TMED161]|nr:hypothetical protein [Candidatus Neomarinimicrobiota bacterium]OUW21461.1 MAG: hypothetical protein CBD21_00710 [bacterium TMED161]|tara:strand:- start:30937 stop:31365 length:429 start_codon:yes stop_codon:yes gene_type:complete
MLTLIAMLMKLLIGSVTSYILTTTIIKEGKIENYFKISFIGILSTSIFSVSYQLDSGGPYMFSAGSLIFLGLICNIFIDEIPNRDRILFFSLLVIGLFIGLGYIFQGIILSFLVYYITINQSDLFSVLLEQKEQMVDDDINI